MSRLEVAEERMRFIGVTLLTDRFQPENIFLVLFYTLLLHVIMGVSSLKPRRMQLGRTVFTV
jgi:hypothetical protein